MDTRDQHGMAAYTCATDRVFLEPVPESSGVLVCPSCGWRSDLPTTGTLADGFDVNHRQWGLRGDPHVWRLMRDRLAETPTPAGAAATRAAYVEAFNAVTGLDLDSEPERRVYNEELDHGGMSGGVVDLEWWRTKGIPLLVERACR
jgi:hypothetical protein